MLNLKAMKKMGLLILSMACVTSLCACSQTKEEKVPYSIGLTEDGMYDGLDSQNLTISGFSNVEFKTSDVLDFCVKAMTVEMGEDFTLDDYLVMEGNTVLSEMGLANKDVVELSDIAIVNLQFYDKDGNLMDDYTHENAGYSVQEGSDEIVQSFIGHKVGENYEMNFTFPDTDQYLPGETVTVNVTIQDVQYSDPIANGIIEENLATIQEKYPTVTDAESFKQAMTRNVILNHWPEYVEKFVSESDEIVVPDVFVDFEVSRLKNRLINLSYDYEAYKTDTQLTDEDIRKSCEQNARVNMVTMVYFPMKYPTVTSEFIKAYYGAESYDYLVAHQGEPYLKLRIMRDLVMTDFATEWILKDENGNQISFAEYAIDYDSIVQNITIPAETQETIQNNE